MKRELPQLIIMLSGAALLAAGIVLVCIQIWKFGFVADPRTGNLTWQGFDFKTHYVGVLVIAFGVLLEIVGYLGMRAKPNT
jgi:uncharacterized membrane protein YidH (DUF202 family)